MKKIIALLMIAVMLMCCLAGCGSKGTTLEEVKTAGKLVVASSPDFPPFEYLGEGNAVEGIEVDILNLICQELGVELDLRQIDFDSVLQGVQSGKYDMGASGISVTEKRQKNMLFTDPYCLAAQAIVVVEGSAIQGKDDLQGKKIAVQTATTAESYCMENGYTVSSFTANNDAQSALISGKVDAWVIDDLTAADMVAAYNGENPAAPLVILDQALTTEPYAFAFAFGSEDLVAEINGILAKLLADQTIAGIFDKYNAPFTAPEQ